MNASSASLSTGAWVTDGGLETDLLFNHGADLPEFASFPLVDDESGRSLLETYYAAYADIAAQAGAGLLVESPTWRANPDWAAKIGYDAGALDKVTKAAVELVQGVAGRAEVEHTLVSGVVGPRGDGYVAGEATAEEAADYHTAQIASMRAAGVDLVHAMTMTTAAEAIGIAWAARSRGLPVAVSFTVETDGRLPDGTTLRDAVAQLDDAASPEWIGVNCAHPTHVLPALDGGDMAGAAGPLPAQRVHDDPRGARQHGGAGRRRPLAARVVHDHSAPAVAVAARRRRLLRHRQSSRGAPLGRGGHIHLTPGAPGAVTPPELTIAAGRSRLVRTIQPALIRRRRRSCILGSGQLLSSLPHSPWQRLPRWA